LNRKIYEIDEQFINSIKQLIQLKSEESDIKKVNEEEDIIKKQWLGYLLISELFDPKLTIISENLLNKNINIIVN
jgi:hypothetical protein